jgi:hypothetical protein
MKTKTKIDPDTVAVFHEVVITRPISLERVKSALCTAFEGNPFWYRVEDYVFPPGTVDKDFSQGGKFNNAPGSGRQYWHPSQIIPTVEGGAVQIICDEISDDFKNQWIPEDGAEKGVNYLLLTKEKLIRGLELMAKRFPKQFLAEFPISNDDAYEGDADTGDIFLQCCLLADEIEKSGDLIFG